MMPDLPLAASVPGSWLCACRLAVTPSWLTRPSFMLAAPVLFLLWRVTMAAVLWKKKACNFAQSREASVASVYYPHRCSELFFLIRPLLRMRAGRAMLEISGGHWSAAQSRDLSWWSGWSIKQSLYTYTKCPIKWSELTCVGVWWSSAHGWSSTGFLFSISMHYHHVQLLWAAAE